MVEVENHLPQEELAALIREETDPWIVIQQTSG